MPPKVRVTKEQIVDAALSLVRQGGVEAVNARAVSGVLRCSTQPIFSNFPAMEQLRLAVAEQAMVLYNACLRRETESGRYPPYKASGMAYIQFAKDEPRLFELLFMRRAEKAPAAQAWSGAVEQLEAQSELSHEDAERFHLEMWVFVHGIATMIATDYLTFDNEQISAMVTDAYMGLRHRYAQTKGGSV